MTPRYWKLGALALSCMAIGAGASLIANAGAATSTGAGAGSATHHAGVRARGFKPRMLVRRAVEGNLVVAAKGGKFVSVTFARGAVSAVNGQELTIAEGTKKATYRTVTLTIPTTARVLDNHRVATLSQVKPGQRVMVIEAPQRTLVFARG